MATILIVEDERNLRMLYAQELRAEGYEVIAVATGSAAREHMRKNRIDLAIIDIKLKDENGLDILRDLMKQDRALKVILNSAYSTFMSEFVSWTADAYLVKSSDLSELKSKVKDLIGGPGSLSAAA